MAKCIFATLIHELGVYHSAAQGTQSCEWARIRERILNLHIMHIASAAAPGRPENASDKDL